jgi:hypothetical protein
MITEYQTQNQLNPILWDDNEQLRPKLRVGFMKIAKAFHDFLDIECDILDVIIIGSSANYNWTEHSDIDLHVVIDFDKINSNWHLVNKYLRAKKSIWNENYPLQLKGLQIELYAQDINEVFHSSVGSYSVLHGKWIKKPTHEQVSIEDDLIASKAEPYEYEIESLKPTDPQIESKIRKIKDRLKHLRQTGLNSAGEFSIENMAFKWLRNKGLLAKLDDLEKNTTMKGLTMESISSDDELAESLVMHITRKNVFEPVDWDNVIQKTDAVTDPRGQWDHPGKCTMIPTADGSITMQNVPHKVLGIDDTGFAQIMHPEQLYQFPGRNVFEIPHTAQWQTLLIQIKNKLQNGTKYE